MDIHIDRIEIEMASRLDGVKAFLHLLQDAVPEFEKRKQEELRELARQEKYDDLEYAVEQQILDEQFQYWLPRYSAYSVVTLLHMVLEAQLHECVRRAEQRYKNSV